MNQDIRRTAKYFFLRFKRLRGTPHSLALGTAIGAAVAITPTLPLHTVMIISLTLLLRANTIAALIVGTIISNPLTFAIHYYAAWKVGDWIFPGRLTWNRLSELLQLIREKELIDGLKTLSHLSMDAILVMMAGGGILALVFALAIYFPAHWLFSTIQEKRRQKHLLG
ncbi:MAG: DUF2062 domain-containing protein [Desulfobulbaceae bacterium]|nr:DUF2062 domain-containing protein [Desulfobulbaceae bacterium]